MWERPSSATHGSGEPVARLAQRRRIRRRRALIALCILIGIAASTLIWGLQQDSVRISRVDVYGAEASLADYARGAMQGSYLGIIPRDSIFFFPASKIRTDIINAYSEIAAVSIFRKGLTGISMKIDYRVPIARWCGLSPITFELDVVNGHGSDEYCYVFDANGYLYAAAATTTQTLNNFSLYAPLSEDTLEPLHATLAHADELPAAFDFARQLDTFGSPTVKVVIRGDEADDYLASGTRITYVIGHEANAFTALTSARDTMDLADGSIEYVDLRFDGKVYLKKLPK
ncbi:MAG: hypothetical protein WA058_01795 [Minisyncoccia bacterium]